jgi:hypothetical protein
MIDKNEHITPSRKRVGDEMKEAENMLCEYIMEIEQQYDSIIADCVLIKVSFDRIADIKQQGEVHYLNDILQAIGKRLEDIDIPSLIALEEITEG